MKNTLLLIGTLVSIFIALYIYRVVHFQNQVSKVYQNQCKVRNGMKLTEVYEALNTQIRPNFHTKFERDDSNYIHTIYYPPKWNHENYLTIEYNPYTSEVVNFIILDCEE